MTFAFKMYAGYLDNDKDGRDDDDVYYKALWWMKTAIPTCFVNKVFEEGDNCDDNDYEWLYKGSTQRRQTTTI